MSALCQPEDDTTRATILSYNELKDYARSVGVTDEKILDTLATMRHYHRYWMQSTAEQQWGISVDIYATHIDRIFRNIIYALAAKLREQ